MITMSKLNPEYRTLKAQGWVEVTADVPIYEGETLIVNLANPDVQCCRLMKNDRHCLLYADHKGKCTSQAFYCDGCGLWKRGRPVSHIYDSNGDATVDFCWWCTHKDDPPHRRGSRPSQKVKATK